MKTGFTLIELLVVVAVVALLAGLLLPGVSRTKGSAQRIKCLSNLRQMGISAQMYWDENNGRAFRYRTAATNGGVIYWFGWLASGSEGQREFDAARGVLYPYLSGRGVEICPALNYALPSFKLKATGAAYGYGYNLLLSANIHDPAININQLRSPHQTALFADAAQINTFQPPASAEHPLLEEFYYFSTNQTEATVHFRHAQHAMAGFCDGHVAREKPAPDSLDTRIPGQMVGRLRPETVIP